MESSSNSSTISSWQATTLLCIGGWVVASSKLGLTRRIRSLTQSWVTRRVLADTPHILQLQSIHNKYLDTFFSALSCIVSISFYTGFLPLLFWSGHSRLARQLTLLMVFCSYIGNALKDVVSAPRPSCPPVRRVTATEEEKDYAMEYGLPSAHTLNTVCFFGYLLHYVMTSGLQRDAITFSIGFALVFLIVALIAIARVYLGMHSLIDVVSGICIGFVVLAFWLGVQGYVDHFIVSGHNVIPFSAGLSFLLFFAYPTPERPTPSFEYQISGNGVGFGIVAGVHQTYMQFHSETSVPQIFSSQLPLQAFLPRVLIGIPTILVVKFCSKALAKCLLPVACNSLGIAIRSSCYIPTLKESVLGSEESDDKQLSYLQRLIISFVPRQTYDVDNGIRFLQYAGLAWSAVDLVPLILNRLNL